MANEKLIVYDGTRYMELEAEPISINGKETGHYKDVNKVYLNINGILDNEEVQEDLKKVINDFHKEHKKNHYFLEEGSLAENYIFSSFSMSPQYESLGDGIVKFIMEKKWMLVSYQLSQISKRNGEVIDIIHFIFNIAGEIDDTVEKNINAYLYPMDALTFSY